MRNDTDTRPLPLEAMRLEVERRMRRGERFADVEDLINATHLSPDEKSALWMLAWSYVHPGAQRREATAHLARLTAATRPPAIDRARHLRIAGKRGSANSRRAGVPAGAAGCGSSETDRLS